MSISTEFLGATALAASMLVASCGSNDPVFVEEQAVLQRAAISLPEQLFDVGTGVYEVGVDGQTCIVSVISTYADRHQLIVGQCEVSTTTADGSIRSIQMPRTITSLPSGVYPIHLSFNGNERVCAASVISTYSNRNQPIVGGCRPL